jgi:uncharacterized membrane protein
MLAGANFARWYWRSFIVGMIAAWGFLMWLFTEAVYQIGFLCLYCMATWTTQSIMLWVIVFWLLREKLLSKSKNLSVFGQKVLPFAWLVAFLNLSLIAIAIVIQFPKLVPLLLGG